MKYSRSRSSAGAKPEVVLAEGGQAGATGSEGTLFRQSRWQVFRCQTFPIGSPVLRRDQLKFPVDGITQGNTMLFVPKGQCIEEGFTVRVFELKDPRLAAI